MNRHCLLWGQAVLCAAVVSFGVTTRAELPEAKCVAWLKAAKLKVGAEDCLTRCSILMTDLGTFRCTDQCDQLCRRAAATSPLAKFVFYPGLTPAEKNLVARSPRDALVVYKLKNLAESSTQRHFPDQSLNDESDAFRHFLWAALLTEKFDEGKASEFLEAHENDPVQPDGERQMDVFNNNRGQTAAIVLVKEKRWSMKKIEAEGLDELRSNKLQVLKPGLPIPKESK